MLRSHPLLRTQSLALVGLWLALPVASALHDGEHAHRYCVEHGAVEEAGEDVAARAPRAGELSEGVEAGEAQEAGSHEACAFTFVRGLGDGAAPTRTDVAAAERVARAEPLPPQDVGARGLPVLAVAPKGSPPRVR